MAGRLLEKARAMQNRAALGVLRPEHQPPDAGQADRAGAHGAGLQSDEEFQSGQAIGPQPRGGGAQGENFGVGGGVGGGDRSVAGAGDDLAARRIEDDCADRHFAGRGRRLRLLKGDAHGGKVMVGHRRQRSDPALAGQGPDAAAPERDAGQGEEAERIAKVLARAGVASRREIERLIAAGRVTLNGALLDTPAVKVGPGDVVAVDGTVVAEAEPTRLFRYHKPPGLVTTHADPKGRPTVFDALPEGLPRLISVGRLDLNSEGLLLLTNDGAVARTLELPANGWRRRYRARARGRIDQSRLDGLKAGLEVDGVRYGPIEARLDGVPEGAGRANVWISVTLTEGKNREVRKVLESLGLTVNRLIRVAFGPFELGVVRPGEVEEVPPRQVQAALAAGAGGAKPLRSGPPGPPKAPGRPAGWAKPRRRITPPAKRPPPRQSTPKKT